MVITRFAPSPTGFLHIGSARTALFNWLFAKANNGKFLLRIEDTDKARSTKPAIDAIFSGLSWLGLNHNDNYVLQSDNQKRHAEVVQMLLDKGQAYYCYTSPAELDALRAEAVKNKTSFLYPRIWRDKDPKLAPKDVKPVVRIKAPLTGKTIIYDKVQGKVEVSNETLDDFVVLRSDGTPTYMLAVVADDHDMKVTHIIRGDDHLTNAFRQKVIYDALGWEVPIFAHIPLIHGMDGAKMSKRHGAVGVDAYKDMGYLPNALRNYLLRLGWSHGNDEIIDDEQAISWFNLENIGKSAARFDFDKLNSLNSHYIKQTEDKILLDLVLAQLETNIDELSQNRLLQGIKELKQRAKTIKELADNSLFYISKPKNITDKAQKDIMDAKDILPQLLELLKTINEWNKTSLEENLRKFSEIHSLKLNQIMSPLRACITGSHMSPSMFEVMEILGKNEIIERVKI